MADMTSIDSEPSRRKTRKKQAAEHCGLVGTDKERWSSTATGYVHHVRESAKYGDICVGCRAANTEKRRVQRAEDRRSGRVRTRRVNPDLVKMLG